MESKRTNGELSVTSRCEHRFGLAYRRASAWLALVGMAASVLLGAGIGISTAAAPPASSRSDAAYGGSGLAAALVQSTSTTLQGGQRVDAIFELNFIVPRGPLMGNRLALEGGLPVHQRLEGPQLETDHFFTVSWQKTF